MIELKKKKNPTPGINTDLPIAKMMGMQQAKKISPIKMRVNINCRLRFLNAIIV
jgi:hypothetical protein